MRVELGSSSHRESETTGIRNTSFSAGFTLLEVMIALAILGISLTVIVEAQQGSMRQVRRSKMLTIASQLARYKMIEIEDELFTEGFSDFEEVEHGDFSDEGFERFTYHLKVDKIELPTNVDEDALTNELGDDASSSTTGVMALGGKMLSSQFEMIRNVLEQSIRRVSLEVRWPAGTSGKKKRSLSVSAYFTDPRRVDQMGAGSGVPPAVSGAPGGSGAGSGGSPSNPSSNNRQPSNSAASLLPRRQ